MSKRKKYNQNRKNYQPYGTKAPSIQPMQVQEAKTKAEPQVKAPKAPDFDWQRLNFWKQIKFTAIKNLFALSDSDSVPVSCWFLLSKPFTLLADNFKIFILAIIPTALLMSAVALITKRGAICAVDSAAMILSQNCSDSTLAFGSNAFIQLLIISFFIIKWYQIALLKRPITVKRLKHTNISLFKTVSIIITFILINAMPLLALGVLLLHTPYPDWRVELVFFTLFAWMFLMPFLAIRFYSVAAFVFEGQPMPSLREVWQKTSGNMLKLLLAFSSIIFLALLFSIRFLNNLRTLQETNFASAFSAEFGLSLITVIFACLWANHCYVQKIQLFKED